MRLPRPSDRRHFLRQATAGCVALGGLAALPAAQAQFRVEISGIGASQIPVAIAPFREEDRAAVAVSQVIRSDLERSGLFRLVPAAGESLDELSRPDFPAWRNRGADALAAGSAARLADGRYDLRFRLWDAVKGADLLGQSLAVPRDDLRRAAHRVADEIYQKLTGERGIFSTRIAYVSKSAGRYTLFVADADGEGAKVAVGGAQPIISPAWSPDGHELAYVSFESGKPVVYAQEVGSGQRRVIANLKGSNSAPAWSPDGSQIAVTLTRDGNSEIYLVGRGGGEPRRLTSAPSIETEAAWSSDGRSIYFVSDRGGGPQIYRMSAAGGNAERVTFSGSYNISPALSPDGRWMAYITRNGGGAFRLQLMDLSSGTVTSLTDTNDDESPSFAPNSRLIIYASRSGGRDVLMTTTLDGSIKARLSPPMVDVREPVWGPFGR
ncbi:Tol-Pal system beta propeller repeat protein TolB [Sphaerotilus uruguayifluvii]|uniref:Tol-Pal system protein TolB n=1 Tax=Sphaerotilus uruguayifluvii TaxID=2735897 RepID=A0ABX2G4C7_9BURK|nr:Tol-Pal system beta propeller repeat protein TolB [Leptothrix sp. C29]NRT56277.1 TolB protein [Leptothrix sp. C29]